MLVATCHLILFREVKCLLTRFAQTDTSFPHIPRQKKSQRSLQKFLEPEETKSQFILIIPWNLAKPVKIFPGIIVRRHHTDQKQMGLLKEQCAE